MSAKTYLEALSREAVLNGLEEINIERSLNSLKKSINDYFGKSVLIHFEFGSYTRKTILPRKYDSNSDVDYLVIFRNNSFRPQTYMEKLRKFVEINYSGPEIYRDHPTVVLELNHIKFELVPGIYNFWNNLQIPAPHKNFFDWMKTSPEIFNHKLNEVNAKYNYLVKPLVRLMKIWNAKADYVFTPYELEQRITNFPYIGFFDSLFGDTKRNLKDMFLMFCNDLFMNEYTKKANHIKALHDVCNKIKAYDAQKKHLEAQELLSQILPRPKGF